MYEGCSGSSRNLVIKVSNIDIIVRIFSNFWLEATLPTCVAKVTYILVLAKKNLLLATGC